jgi:hypothetical protein
MKIVLWEYMYWRCPIGASMNQVLRHLNELGGLGWELVINRETIVEKGDVQQKINIFILKRPCGQGLVDPVK